MTELEQMATRLNAPPELMEKLFGGRPWTNNGRRLNMEEEDRIRRLLEALEAGQPLTVRLNGKVLSVNQDRFSISDDADGMGNFGLDGDNGTNFSSCTASTSDAGFVFGAKNRFDLEQDRQLLAWKKMRMQRAKINALLALEAGAQGDGRAARGEKPIWAVNLNPNNPYQRFPLGNPNNNHDSNLGSKAEQGVGGNGSGSGLRSSSPTKHRSGDEARPSTVTGSRSMDSLGSDQWPPGRPLTSNGRRRDSFGGVGFRAHRPYTPVPMTPEPAVARPWHRSHKSTRTRLAPLSNERKRSSIGLAKGWWSNGDVPLRW